MINICASTLIGTGLQNGAVTSPISLLQNLWAVRVLGIKGVEVDSRQQFCGCCIVERYSNYASVGMCCRAIQRQWLISGQQDVGSLTGTGNHHICHTRIGVRSIHCDNYHFGIGYLEENFIIVFYQKNFKNKRQVSPFFFRIKKKKKKRFLLVSLLFYTYLGGKITNDIKLVILLSIPNKYYF